MRLKFHAEGVSRWGWRTVPQFTRSPPFVGGLMQHLKAACLVYGAHIGGEGWIHRDPGWVETEFSGGSLELSLLYRVLKLGSARIMENHTQGASRCLGLYAL